jgi:hypothetical protein
VPGAVLAAVYTLLQHRVGSNPTRVANEKGRQIHTAGPIRWKSWHMDSEDRL